MLIFAIDVFLRFRFHFFSPCHAAASFLIIFIDAFFR